MGDPLVPAPTSFGRSRRPARIELSLDSDHRRAYTRSCDGSNSADGQLSALGRGGLIIVEVLLVAGTILALDQVSKALVVRRLATGQAVPMSAWAPVRIRHLRNARPGLGLVRGARALALLWGCAVLMALALAQGPRADDLVGQTGLGAALGGAAGNLLDRLRRGGVVDFIDLRVWPVFNLADLDVVGGVAVALWSVR